MGSARTLVRLRVGERRHLACAQGTRFWAISVRHERCVRVRRRCCRMSERMVRATAVLCESGGAESQQLGQRAGKAQQPNRRRRRRFGASRGILVENNNNNAQSQQPESAHRPALRRSLVVALEREGPGRVGLAMRFSCDRGRLSSAGLELAAVPPGRRPLCARRGRAGADLRTVLLACPCVRQRIRVHVCVRAFV